MFLVRQALAEYVGLTLSRLSADAGAALRHAGRYLSDHFVVVLLVLIGAVVLVMLTSGSRR